jgi:hypothetical protein
MAKNAGGTARRAAVAAVAGGEQTVGTGERAAGESIRVRATATCFYDDVRYRPGDVFELYPRTGTFSEYEIDEDTGKPVIDDSDLIKHKVTREVHKTLTAEEQFNPKCMVKVSARTPERTSSARDRIRDEHDRILRDRLAGGAARPEPGQGGEPAAQGKPAEGHRPTVGPDGGATGDSNVLD